MNAQNPELARLVIAARIAAAQDRQLARDVRAMNRAERRSRPSRWERRTHWLAAVRQRFRNRPPGFVPTLVPTGTSARVPVAVEVARLLDAAATRIAERGMAGEERLLGAMAEVARESLPGASALLVDPAAPEVARLRAFGVVHLHIAQVLGPREHARLLALMLVPGYFRPGDRVA